MDSSGSTSGSEPQLDILALLHKVPHLAHACATQHVLKELRSSCSEARYHSDSLITGLTVDLEEPFPAIESFSLMSVLERGRLRRLCVVLYLHSHGGQRDILKARYRNTCVTSDLTERMAHNAMSEMWLRGAASQYLFLKFCMNLVHR